MPIINNYAQINKKTIDAKASDALVSRYYRARTRSGHTMIELIVSIVIISVAIVGMLLAFNTTARASANPIVTHQSAAIAAGYIEEILLQAFPTTLPCPAPPVGGRSKYTNVCDYNNLIDVGIKNYKGDAISSLSGYTATVTLDTATASLGGLVSGTQVVRIDVFVKLTGSNSGVLLSAYKTNY